MRQSIRVSGYRSIRSLLLVFFLQCLLLIVQPVFAQEIPRFQGEEVVVTAARIPQAVGRTPWNASIITSRELQNFKTVADALRLQAGVDGTAYGYLGSLNSIRLRGTNASQVLILVDGRRVNSPTLGMVDLGDILTDNVERVEVIRAPLSALYGSDAVSGAINVITKSPKERAGALAVSSGMFGTQNYQLSYATPTFYLAANQLKSDGFRQNGDYLGDKLFGKVNLPFILGQVVVDYDYYSGVKGVPGVPTSEADPYSATEPTDRQKDVNLLLSAALKGDNYQFRVYQNDSKQNLAPYIWGVSTNETGRVGVEWQQNFALPLGSMVYGVEAREDKGKTTMSGDHTIRNYALFVQDDLTLNDRYTLSASIRGDKHSTAGISVNPRVGLTYQPTNDFSLKASAGTAFRAPTLNELYWNDGWMFGNPSLKPEKSFSWELALERQFSSTTSAKLSYYSALTTDLILWDWLSSTIETRAKNIGEGATQGVEFEYLKQFGERGKAFINFTYQKAIDQKDIDTLAEGKTLRYTPLVKGNVGLFYNESSVLIRHVGERWADTYNTVKLAPYTVVDLGWRKKVGSMAIELEIDNLLDEKYSEVVGNDPTTFASRNYPMPGRRYSLGVKFEL